MKNSFRKLIPVAAALGFAFAASSAQAFTLKDGSNNVLAYGATSLDWNETGSGVAKGIGPFGAAPTVGQQFQFLYQANLATVNVSADGDTSAQFGGLDTNANGRKGAGKTFEFTIVAKLNEVVTGLGLSDNKPIANFGVDTTKGPSKVAIYYDTAADANIPTGTGFNNGKMIALLTIVPDGTSSNFQLTQFDSNGNAVAGGGTTKLSAKKVGSDDFIDPAYLEGVSEMLFGLKFDSNLNYPAGTSYTTNFQKGNDTSLFQGYTVDTNKDIVFKVDSATTLVGNAVPEPGTMMLLGMGMLGLVGAKRRRAPKA